MLKAGFQVPYYLLHRTADPGEITDWDERPAYPDRQTAHAALQEQVRKTATRDHKVVYHATATERATWRCREEARFETGEYRPVPWAAEAVNANGVDLSHHYAHLSLVKDGMVAYTPDEESGIRDRQVRVRAGRYLEQFYGHVAPHVRDRWVAACKPLDTSRLKFAAAPDEIKRLYRGSRIASCMAGTHHEWDYGSPVRAYGDSDLQVAYMGDLDSCTARVVVWPARKRYSRVYGDNLIVELLQAQGYEGGSMSGARIRAIRCDGGYVVPYVDGISYAHLDKTGEYLVLGSGDISTSETRGYARADDDDDEDETCDHCGYQTHPDNLDGGLCEDCQAARRTCEHCADVFFDEDEVYCADCRERVAYCEVCESDTFGSTYLAIADRNRHSQITVCESCTRDDDRSQFICEFCGCREYEWQYEPDTQRARRADGSALHLCVECAAEAVRCHVCAAWIDLAPVDAQGRRLDPPAACPECATTAYRRDTTTAPLPFDADADTTTTATATADTGA